MSRFTDLLANPAAEKRCLVVLEPYDVDAAATVTLRYSSGGFNTAPTDSPPNTHYYGRIKQAPVFERSLFAQGRLSGRSIPGAGTIVLNNEDGALDVLTTYAWGGRRVRAWLGGVDFALDEFGLVIDGTAQGTPEADNNEITINLRDLSYIFDREIQPAKFLGTGGAEGAADLAGRRKPMAYGVCRGVAPLYLGPDSGRHLFSVGDAAIVGVLSVSDQGVPLTFTAGTPTAGQWTANLATGIVTLGGSFVGPVKCDIIGRRYLSATSTTSRSVGTGSRAFTISSGLAFAIGMRVRVARTSALSSIWMDGLVASYSGGTLTVTVDSVLGSGTYTDWTISPWGTAAGIAKAIGAAMGVSNIDAMAFAALDAAQPATVGMWVAEGGLAGQILDELMDGIGGHWGFTRAGLYQVGRLTLPGASVMSITKMEILEPGPKREPIDEPNHEVVVKYRRCWSPSTDDQIAGSVPDSDRVFLTNEWRQVVADDSDVLTAYPLSQPIEVDSVFDLQADAAAEAERLLTMFGVPRSYFRVSTKVEPLAVDLGETATATYSRNGLAAGKDFVVAHIAEDLTDMQVTLGLWG